MDNIRGLWADAFPDAIQMDQLSDHLDLPDQIQILEALQSTKKIFEDKLKTASQSAVQIRKEELKKDLHSPLKILLDDLKKTTPFYNSFDII